MTFKKGDPKLGGRKAGTPNKATRTYRESLEAADFNLADQAIKLYKDPETPPELKAKLLGMMHEYSQAKPKDVDSKQAEEIEEVIITREMALAAVKGS